MKLNETLEDLKEKLANLKLKESNLLETDFGDESKYRDLIDEIYIVESKIDTLMKNKSVQYLNKGVKITFYFYI